MNNNNIYELLNKSLDEIIEEKKNMQKMEIIFLLPLQNIFHIIKKKI